MFESADLLLDALASIYGHEMLRALDLKSHLLKLRRHLSRLGAIIARRGDERVYERHDTLRRAQKKNEDQEKGTPLPLFPNKGRKKLYTNRENDTMGERNESQKYHTTRVKQKEKERRRRRKRRICAWTDTKKENTTRGRRVTTVY